MMVAAAGNNGPNCSTEMYPPAIYAATYVVGATVSASQWVCVACTLATVSGRCDCMTSPALAPDGTATCAQGEPPLWVTSNSGVPTAPADTPPNSAAIGDPAVVSDKRLDS